MCPRAASCSGEQRRADPVATGCQGKCPPIVVGPCAHMAASTKQCAGVSFAAACAVCPAGDVTRGSATLAVADPNFEGRSVAVGDPLEGRGVCACAQPLCCRRLRAWGAPWGRPSFRALFLSPGAAPARRPRSLHPEQAAAVRERHPAPRATAACVRPARPPHCSLFPLVGPCNQSPNGHDHRCVVACGRPVGLPYRFAYASRPHSRAALSPPKSTLVSFQAAAIAGLSRCALGYRTDRVIHNRYCALRACVASGTLLVSCHVYPMFCAPSSKHAHTFLLGRSPRPPSPSRQGCFGQCRAIRAAPRGSCRRAAGSR